MTKPGGTPTRARWSIHAHLALLVTVVMVPLCCLTLYLVLDRVHDEEQKAREGTLRVAEAAAQNLNQFIRDSEVVLTNLALRLQTDRTTNRNIDARLREFLGLHPDYINVFVTDGKARIVASAVPRPPDQALSTSDIDWYESVQRTRRFTVSSARLGQITGKWLAVIACPMGTAAPGKPVEVLGISIDLNRFQRAIEGVQMAKGGVISVVDRQGTFVARTPGSTEWRGQNVIKEKHIRTALESDRGHVLSTGVDGVVRNYSYTKVGASGWSVLAGVPEGEVLAGARSNALTSLWLILLVIGIVTGMVWILGQRIRRPINALARSSQAIAERRSSELLRISGPREVALAADSFNRMLAARLESDQALERSERRYRLLFEASPLPMWVFDLETRQFLAVNLAAVNLYGYSAEEFFRMTVEDLRPAEETRQSGRDARQVTTALGQVAVWRHQKKNGTTLLVQITSHVVEFGGRRAEMVLVQDVTTRVEAERALRRSEQRFRSLVSATSAAVWTTDAEGKVVDDLPSWRTFTGQGSSESRGNGWLKALHEEDQPAVTAAWKQALQRQRSFEIEFRLRRADGEWREVHSRTVPLFNPEGRLIEWVGVCHDITERKRAEMALRDSQSLLERAQAVAHVGSWTSAPGPEGSLKWSAETCRIFGLTPEQFDGKVETFFNAVHPEDRTRVRENSRAVLAKEKSYDLEHRIVRPDGSIRWVREQCEVDRDPAGKPLRMVGVVHDITERKLAELALREREERLRLALEVARMATWELDLRTQAVNATSEISQMFGGPNQRRLTTNEEFMERIHPNDRAAVQAAVRDAIEEREPYHHQFRVVWLDASVHWLEGRGEVFSEPGGQPRRMIGVTVDITERKRAEQELRELSAQLLRAQDEERRRLARELHDSTAQKLAALALNLSRMVRSQESAEERIRHLTADSLRLAEQSAQEIRTISYLLHPPLLEELGLAGALRNYTEGFSQRSGVAVKLLFPAPLERLASEVELAVFRVVQESLANVYRHSGSPDAEIEIRREGLQLQVEVRDHGHGIASGTHKRDEDPLDALGVGVAGMRQRMRSLGGELDVESSTEGTTVRARIPFAPPVETNGQFRLTHE